MAWTPKIPKEEGWYWIKYRVKNSYRMCPASVMWLGKRAIVRPATSGTSFTDQTREFFGYKSARFGPKIEPPA